MQYNGQKIADISSIGMFMDCQYAPMSCGIDMEYQTRGEWYSTEQDAAVHYRRMEMKRATDRIYVIKNQLQDDALLSRLIAKLQKLRDTVILLHHVLLDAELNLSNTRIYQ